MDTRIVSITALKTKLTEVLKEVLSGEEIGISDGRKGEVIARLVPERSMRERRHIGILEEKATVIFSQDFNISEDEFLGR